MTAVPARNRRADARRSRAAILDAAARVLNAEPDASLETIAAAAGVTRQTVHAHFPSREKLLLAVVGRLTEETIAAMDAADLDAGPAKDALIRLLDAGEQVARRYPGLLQKISTLLLSPQEDHDLHTSVGDRIERVIRRGRRTGEFDDRLPIGWLVAAVVKLAHAAGEESATARMTSEEARDALHTSVLRMLGAAADAGRSPGPR
ncbi:TetR/AcrR family transcriptional regulator [Nonomuraea sp. SYSU D8015]|uniref:TetR/AcrR family transcriptional regulator n=1 Tax=Nonomuraea sp. SYSU D8015 TaxID=2593644 RepID=UPI001660A3FF|nr:TetR/AcrR family transcriptional regulator [Nonomuraea sp. SYSU D8015]